MQYLEILTLSCVIFGGQGKVDQKCVARRTECVDRIYKEQKPSKEKFTKQEIAEYLIYNISKEKLAETCDSPL